MWSHDVEPRCEATNNIGAFKKGSKNNMKIKVWKKQGGKNVGKRKIYSRW